MHVALYETGLEGHRGAYLLALAKECSRRNWRATIVTAEPDKNQQILSELRSLVGSENVITTPFRVDMPRNTSPVAMLWYHISQWKAARSSLQYCRRSWDCVYFLNLDYMDKAIQIFGTPLPTSSTAGMSMRVRFHLRELGLLRGRPSVFSRLEALSFSRLLSTRGMARIMTADPTLVAYCRTQHKASYSKVQYVPEIGMLPSGTDPTEAKRSLGFREHDTVILVFGALNERKAIEELLDAAETLPESLNVRVLIVGKPDLATEEKLNDERHRRLIREGRLTVRLRYADEKLQETAFAAANLVWVAYRGHSTMSGVFCQAMCCGLPVIAPNHGVVSWMADRYKAGVCVDIEDPSQLAADLETLIRDQERIAEYKANARAVGVNHYPTSFAGAICDSIAEAC